MSIKSLNPTKLALLAALAASFTCQAAFAQGGFSSTSQSGRHKDLGDGASFYMARRQYQVVDDSPIVKYSGGPGGAAAAAGGNSNLPGGQAPLQRAGFTSYSTSLPTITAPLPKVNNGVPVQPAPAALPKSSSAKAGSLGKGKKVSAKPAPAPRPAEPDGIHAYNSYKGYNPSAALPYGTTVPGGAAGSSMSRSGNVKGSVLHWSRRRRAAQ